MGRMNATTVAHVTSSLSLHSEVIKSKDSAAKCQKAAGGKPQREPGFIVMLFDYSQVKWKVYLHPLKITFSLRKMACTVFCNCPAQRERIADE